MHINKVVGLLVLLCCELCLTIKVPIVWKNSGNSAVNNEASQTENLQPQKVQTLQSQSIPKEYFQYTAQKPQFATDIATFHGVHNPQEHYKAYPIRPITGQKKPLIGIHHILNQDKIIYKPYQNYVQQTEDRKNHVQPVSTGYEIFHPYKAEEPALQAIYKDPTLSKIRNDLQNTKNRLQAYEQEAGQVNIASDEYLEGEQKTDKKLFPHNNAPARYEVHKPERRPVYYQVPPRETPREHVLNQKFKHPWNQHHVKIRPMHYKPLKNHIHNLRQQHAAKYDDERNEYPQVIIAENIGEQQEGQDIYERGKEKYIQLRNNVDTSINKIVQQNKPIIYENLELQKNEPQSENEEDEFIPIKNYAQVRKTETFKHVPRKTAFDDAETLEEIINAPRLREAVKSSKAQIVYSEEGYEDSAYDHAGEQKHASDHEGHGGFLKQKESSAGLYKIPTVLGNYEDGKGSEFRDNIEHGKKWKNKDKEDEEESEAEDHSDVENEESIEANIYSNRGPQVTSRNKREGEAGTGDDDLSNNDTVYNENIEVAKRNTLNETKTQHDVDKREADFQVPEINLETTYLTEEEILKLSKLNLQPKQDNIRDKYPYYFKNLKQINKNSPLRYAENLKFIPNKSEGGTEFYDSRSILECPEVDDNVDPIPQKLKSGDNPTEENSQEEESNSKQEKEFDIMKKQPRLKGLGDKIDCFKAKYFGENPLDSPFFKEEIISSPEPIKIPNLPIHKQLNVKKELISEASNVNNNIGITNKIKEVIKPDIFALLDKLRTDTKQLQESVNRSNSDLKAALLNQGSSLPSINNTKLNTSNVLMNIKNQLEPSLGNLNKSIYSINDGNVSSHIQDKENVKYLPPNLRKKRSTPFIYEPYKIIKDNQYQDSKKTTTSSNISPLIKQLQSSRVADRVSRSNRDDKLVKSNTNSRSYVDIGRKDRDKSIITPTIVDVSIDKRRGEPRYEIRPPNHKSEYTPVENKKNISLEDYKTHSLVENTQDIKHKAEETSDKHARNGQRMRQRTAVRPFYDVSHYLPTTTDNQNVAESNAVKKIVTNATPQILSKEIEIRNNSDKDHDESEDYDDDEEEDEDEDEPTTSTTTTTSKPSFRRRIKLPTTTEKSQHTSVDEPERLRLITRFRNYKPSEKPKDIEEFTKKPTLREYKEEESTIPRYREKKKKSTKSTLVTDTQKYGEDEDEDEDEMGKEEVDALIGVKQDMEDYMPLYEKEEKEKERNHYHSKKKYDQEKDSHNDNDDEDDDDEDDDDDDDDDDIDDDDVDDDDDDNQEEDDVEERSKPVVTTPEPIKRTLARTTEAPLPTTATYVRTVVPSGASKLMQPENKPIVTRKKIEIHKELPVNKSSPHVTQFKQDIKEVEIIKESPIVLKQKPKIKGEVLELYKDDNLAKDINKLGDVEIFDENIDLDAKQKHGGNYRKATKEDLKLLKPYSSDNIKPPRDTEASQSENTKHVEFDQYSPRQLHGGNLKPLNDVKRTRNTGRNAKFIELRDPSIGSKHGGNLKYDNKRNSERRNEKLIEFDDDHNDEHSSQDDDYKSSSHNTRTDRLHGGNYRSEKLVEEKKKESDDIRARTPDRGARRSADLLNSFVQAVPVLTTTPSYILDPSKRMYYYLDP